MKKQNSKKLKGIGVDNEIIPFISLTKEESKKFSKLGETPLEELSPRKARRYLELETKILEGLDKEIGKL